MKRFLLLLLPVIALYVLISLMFVPKGANSSVDVLSEQDLAEIKGTVSLYNKIYQDFYASNGVPAMLDNFPTNKQLRHEVFRDIGYLRDNKLIMIYDMANQIVNTIEPMPGGMARAIVYEEWNYLYRSLEGRKLAKNIKGMSQGFEYLLNRTADGWMIIDMHPDDIKMEIQHDEY